MATGQIYKLIDFNALKGQFSVVSWSIVKGAPCPG